MEGGKGFLNSIASLFTSLTKNDVKEIRTKKLQKEIKECLRDECDASLSLSGKALIFSDELVRLINKYSSSEEGQFLVDKAFNSLDLNCRNEIVTIEVFDKRLKYFPILEGFDNVKTLISSFNELNRLDVQSLKNLEELKCFHNNLTDLHIQGLEKLKTLDCSNNFLAELSFEGLENLEIVDCFINRLKKLDFIFGQGKNLKELHCSRNRLSKSEIERLKDLLPDSCDFKYNSQGFDYFDDCCGNCIVL